MRSPLGGPRQREWGSGTAPGGGGGGRRGDPTLRGARGLGTESVIKLRGLDLYFPERAGPRGGRLGPGLNRHRLGLFRRVARDPPRGGTERPGGPARVLGPRSLWAGAPDRPRPGAQCLRGGVRGQPQHIVMVTARAAAAAGSELSVTRRAGPGLPAPGLPAGAGTRRPGPHPLRPSGPGRRLAEALRAAAGSSPASPRSPLVKTTYEDSNYVQSLNGCN